MERLDKFLCDCGAGTRSQVKAILKAGRVTVDGKTEKDNGRKIDPNTQTVCLDGEVLCLRGRLVIMLNKPAGYVTATEDAREATVMELLPVQFIRRTYVGEPRLCRIDRDEVDRAIRVVQVVVDA